MVKGVKGILVDTNAYTAFKRNVIEAVEVIRCCSLIGMNTIVIGELLGGFACGSKEGINKQELQNFLKSSRVRVFSITDTTSHHYAQIYSSLRKKGKPIPTNDIWIAATAFEHNLSLFSYDSDFQFIDNLIVGNCWDVLKSS
jgi:tRNA(fMet)-specific endonuclease VapC